MGYLLGYARVSTTDQQPQLQVDALERAGCYRVFTETASGARTDRPTLEQLLDQLRPGDTLVVWKLDRLGRSLRHLVDTIEDTTQRRQVLRLAEHSQVIAHGAWNLGPVTEPRNRRLPRLKGQGLTAAPSVSGAPTGGRMGGRPCGGFPVILGGQGR